MMNKSILFLYLLSVINTIANEGGILRRELADGLLETLKATNQNYKFLIQHREFYSEINATEKKDSEN